MESAKGELKKWACEVGDRGWEPWELLGTKKKTFKVRTTTEGEEGRGRDVERKKKCQLQCWH